MKDLKIIMKDCYVDPYTHKDITKEALAKVIDEVSAIFTNAMNETLGKEITKNELHRAVKSVARGKAPGHDGIPLGFFQNICHTLSKNFHIMIRKIIEEK
jgi:hypothetical protein